MNVLPRALLICGLFVLVAVASGCAETWHNLQPHRLHQLNRGPGMPTGAEAYSSLDPLRPLIS